MNYCVKGADQTKRKLNSKKQKKMKQKLEIEREFSKWIGEEKKQRDWTTIDLLKGTNKQQQQQKNPLINHFRIKIAIGTYITLINCSRGCFWFLFYKVLFLIKCW